MTKKSKNKCNYEDEQYNEPFDIIDDDLNLLLILVLIEAYKENENEVRFTRFMKGAYWNYYDFEDSIFDQGYFSTESMIIGQIDFLIEDQRLGNLIGFLLDDPKEVLYNIVVDITKMDSFTEEDIQYIIHIMEQIIILEYKNNEQKKAKVEKNVNEYIKVLQNKSIFINKDKRYIDIVGGFVDKVPKRISLKFIFDEKGIEKFEQEVKDYIDKFINDEFQSELSFVKQMRNFHFYINKFDLIGNTINIPFSIISEKDFKAIKILAYLKLKKIISFKISDEDSWDIKFNKIPITINSLLGFESNKDYLKTSKLKFNLSFDKDTDILTISKESELFEIKFQGQVQKEVMREIFKYHKNTYSKWSLYDISDALGGTEVNEISVKNAIYQINRKIKLKVPELEKLFLYDKHSAILNEEYINKN